MTKEQIVLAPSSLDPGVDEPVTSNGALIERSAVVDQVVAERPAAVGASQAVADDVAFGISELPTGTSSTATASSCPTPSTPSSATIAGTAPTGGHDHAQILTGSLPLSPRWRM